MKIKKCFETVLNQIAQSQGCHLLCRPAMLTSMTGNFLPQPASMPALTAKPFPLVLLWFRKTKRNLQKPCRLLVGAPLHVWHCPDVQPTKLLPQSTAAALICTNSHLTDCLPCKPQPAGAHRKGTARTKHVKLHNIAPNLKPHISKTACPDYCSCISSTPSCCVLLLSKPASGWEQGRDAPPPPSRLS